MNQVEWDRIAETLEYGFTWRTGEEWTDTKERVYRTWLDGYEQAPVLAALGKLMLAERKWGPAIADIVGAIEHDPGIPQWPAVQRIIFASDSELRRLGDLHPALQQWISRQGGLRALRLRPVNDEQSGRWEAKELRESWAEHVEQWTGRRHHTIALGRGDGNLTRLQPLAAAGLAPVPSAPQIGAAA